MSALRKLISIVLLAGMAFAASGCLHIEARESKPDRDDSTRESRSTGERDRT